VAGSAIPGYIGKVTGANLVFIPFIPTNIPDNFESRSGTLKLQPNPKNPNMPTSMTGVLAPQIPRSEPGAGVFTPENKMKGTPGEKINCTC